MRTSGRRLSMMPPSSSSARFTVMILTGLRMPVLKFGRGSHAGMLRRSRAGDRRNDSKDVAASTAIPPYPSRSVREGLISVTRWAGSQQATVAAANKAAAVDRIVGSDAEKHSRERAAEREGGDEINQENKPTRGGGGILGDREGGNWVIVDSSFGAVLRRASRVTFPRS
jgi:hypothetical protein